MRILRICFLAAFSLLRPVVAGGMPSAALFRSEPRVRIDEHTALARIRLEGLPAPAASRSWTHGTRRSVSSYGSLAGRVSLDKKREGKEPVDSCSSLIYCSATKSAGTTRVSSTNFEKTIS